MSSCVGKRVRNSAGLSLRVVDSEGNSEWITKWDGADDTHVEATKGGLSDAEKRAAVKWGIGRYLYDLSEGWADCSLDLKAGRYYANSQIGKKGQKEEYIKFSWNPPRLPDWACLRTNAAVKSRSDRMIRQTNHRSHRSNHPPRSSQPKRKRRPRNQPTPPEKLRHRLRPPRNAAGGSGARNAASARITPAAPGSPATSPSLKNCRPCGISRYGRKGRSLHGCPITGRVGSAIHSLQRQQWSGPSMRGSHMSTHSPQANWPTQTHGHEAEAAPPLGLLQRVRDSQSTLRAVRFAAADRSTPRIQGHGKKRLFVQRDFIVPSLPRPRRMGRRQPAG